MGRVASSLAAKLALREPEEPLDVVMRGHGGYWSRGRKLRCMETESKDRDLAACPALTQLPAGIVVLSCPVSVLSLSYFSWGSGNFQPGLATAAVRRQNRGENSPVFSLLHRTTVSFTPHCGVRGPGSCSHLHRGQQRQVHGCGSLSALGMCPQVTPEAVSGREGDIRGARACSGLASRRSAPAQLELGELFAGGTRLPFPPLNDQSQEGERGGFFQCGF